MCFLTVATAVRYAQVHESASVYHFVVRTDEEGLSRIRGELAEADLRGFEDAKVADGLYRISVRCSKEKTSLLWSILGGRPGR